MKKQINAIILLAPAQGQTNVTVPFVLEPGFVESIVAVSRGNEDKDIDANNPKSMVFIGLKDNSGNQIIPSLPIELFKQRTGSYIHSFKPLNMDTLGKGYVLTMETERISVNDLSKDIQVFVVFNYDTKTK